MGFSQSRLIFSPFGTIIQVGVFCSEHLFLLFFIFTEPEKWTDEELGIPPDDE